MRRRGHSENDKYNRDASAVMRVVVVVSEDEHLYAEINPQPRSVLVRDCRCLQRAHRHGNGYCDPWS